MNTDREEVWQALKTFQQKLYQNQQRTPQLDKTKITKKRKEFEDKFQKSNIN